jgi:hypothetical protein
MSTSEDDLAPMSNSVLSYRQIVVLERDFGQTYSAVCLIANASDQAGVQAEIAREKMDHPSGLFP